MFHRTKPRFEKDAIVIFKLDSKHQIFQVYKVLQSGYMIFNVRSRVFLPNLVPEEMLLLAKEGVDYEKQQ